jgi:hypothetical protein
MPKTTPSQVATAIESMFGAASNDLAETAPNQTKQVEVRALLSLLDDLPNDLPTLSFTDNLEFVRCRAALATVLPMWSRGETRTTTQPEKTPLSEFDGCSKPVLMSCPAPNRS